MKTNFYINKKSSGLIGVLMILSSTLSFSAAKVDDQARYKTIVQLYLAGNLNTTVKDDIQVVQQHKDAFNGQLASGNLTVAGKGLAAIALAGGLTAAMGKIGRMVLYDRRSDYKNVSDWILSLSNNEWRLIQLSRYTLPMALGSLVLAGISYYLLNKSAKNERLQAEIRRDDAIITELNAIHT